MEYIQGSLFGKTSPEHSQATMDGISQSFSANLPDSSNQVLPMFLCLKKDGRTQAFYWSVGGGSIAYRTHDAQFWGVPQRRKRIALVVDFRGESAPEILFERKGLSGNIEQGEAQRKDITETIGRSFDNTISFQERSGKPGGAKES